MLMRVSYVDYLPQYPDDWETYTPTDLTVRVVGRNAEGERDTRYIEGTRPHVWVPADEPIPSTDDDDNWFEVLEVDDGYKGIDIDAGAKVDAKRVTLGHPKQTDAFLDHFSQSFEGDIPFYRRVSWDHDLTGYIEVPDGVSRLDVQSVDADIDPEDIDDPISPRVAIGDIEVVDDSDRGFDEMKQAADAPIKAATWYDTYDEEYLVVVVDDDGEVVPSRVKDELAQHWGDHDDAERFVEGSDITLAQVDTEADLLNTSIGWLQRKNVDLTAGWNWVDFDWYYLLERCSRLDDVLVHDLSDLGRVEMRKVNPDRRGTESAVEGLPAFDQMSGLHKQTYGEWRSKALEFVASDQLGIGKIPDITVADAYEHQRSLMTAYNLLDVQLTVALTEMHGIEDFFFDLADICGIQIQDTFSEKREVQGYIGKRRDDDEVMPTNEVTDIETPAGGLVLTPGDGIYNDVGVIDLKSLYPSSIGTCNISPETLTMDLDEADVVIPGMPEKAEDVGGSIEPSDINWEDPGEDAAWSQRPKGFTLQEQGLLPKYALQMFPVRENRKTLRNQYAQDSTEWTVYDNQQRGIKVVHNSMFGVENSKYFPLAKDGIGDAITGVSRYVLWRAAEYIRDLGYEVIYGDTDSLLISLDYKENRRRTDALVKDLQGVQSQLNRHMTEVADDLGLPDAHPFMDVGELPHELDTGQHCWFFEAEKVYDRFIQVGSKKRYAGELDWKEGERKDGDLDVTGFESERSDQMEKTAEVQREVIKLVLGDADFTEVSEYVRGQIERFTADTDDLHEIGVPWNLNKPLGDGSAAPNEEGYGNLPRARAARFSNEHLDTDYGPGDDFRGYYVSRTPSFVPETDVIALDWTDAIPADYVLNVPKTVEKAFESALTPLLEEVGWTFNEVREGKRNQPAAETDMTQYTGDPWADDGTEPEDPGPEDGQDTESPADGSDDPSDDELGGAALW